MKRLLTIYFAVLIYSHSFSQTIGFSGSITQNTVWDYDTVKIIGDVTINSGSTLTINAGTLIQFQGNYKISSVGSLHLLGSMEKNIVFTINDTTGYSSNRYNIGWGGLELKYNWDGGSYGNSNSNDSTIIDYCVFEYSKVGAIAIENFSKIRISNSVFRRNYGSSGSGINLYFSNALINNCSFFENYSYNSGGAMSLLSASPKIYNSTFINNEGSQGGAIDITGNDAWLINNIFYYNSTYNGGAIKFHGFDGILANNIICFNKAKSGGGAIYGGSGQLLLVNNTICNNNSDYAPGIYLGDDYFIYNTIFFGNRSTSSNSKQIYNFLSDYRPTVQNCIIEDGKDYNSSLFTNFKNVYFDNPNFVKINDTLTYNRDSIIYYWSIDSSSICIDKGITTYYRSTELDLKNDITNNTRISNNHVDIGAFECQNPNPDIPNFISNNEKECNLFIYPNPTNGNLWISSASNQLLAIELFDITGRLMQSKSFHNNTQIDLAEYKQGVYLLLVKQNNETIIANKIMKY